MKEVADETRQKDDLYKQLVNDTNNRELAILSSISRCVFWTG